MADDGEKGHGGAHTQPPAQQPGAAELDLGAAIGDQAREPGDGDAMAGADPAALVAGLPIEDSDVLAMAAELVAAPRRARGRPPGSPNRKNADMIAYLAAKGHRDPWLTLSMIQTADTKALARALCVEPVAVLSIQERAATTLMKYHHAQMPQQVELALPTARPLMVIGEMNVNIVDAGGFMSAGLAPDEKVNEISGDVVRETEPLSHGSTEPSDTNGLASKPTD